MCTIDLLKKAAKLTKKEFIPPIIYVCTSAVMRLKKTFGLINYDM